MSQAQMEYKVVPQDAGHARLDAVLELKMLTDDGRFAGYASVFDVIDSQRDMVRPGAFAKSIIGRVAQIKLLWQHAMGEPIGYFTAMFEDAHGLYVEGQLMLEVGKAREAYALLKAGVVRGLSIGYAPVRAHVDAHTGVRHLDEVNLWEVSLVTFPANEAAQVTVVKAAAPADADVAGLDDAIERLIQLAYEQV